MPLETSWNNIFSGMWTDDRMDGYDMVRGVMSDVASAFMWPLHILDMVWPGDIYNSDIHQYNPLTWGKISS